MSTFTLTIELDNAAMSNRADVARALEGVADRLHVMFEDDPTVGAIWDAKGNKVGRWEIT